MHSSLNVKQKVDKILFRWCVNKLYNYTQTCNCCTYISSVMAFYVLDNMLIS